MGIVKIMIMILLLLGSVSDEIGIDIRDKHSKTVDLTQEDFSVSDGVDTIVLDMLRTEVVVHRELTADEPTNPMNHFVGEIYDGDYFYKLYAYQYDGIEITSSNLDYEKKERDQYTFYITQIKVSDTTFSTPRGIYIGSSKQEVVNAYGKGKKLIENDSDCWLYYYEGKGIIFKFDKEDYVKEIRFAVYKKE